MDLKLTQNVAFVTGGASGIGRATAVAFAKEGAKVAIADVRDEGAETAEQIQKIGGEALFVHCDTSNEDEIKRAVQTTIERFGRLDHAFNNAGIEGLPGTTVDCTTENWDRVVDIDLKGVWLCMKHEIPQMLKQGSGSIVNCSSVAGLVGFPRIPAYAASKHGVIGLTRTTALEYATSNIRVNAVCPGVIETAMVERFIKADASAGQALLTGEPIGRLGRPEEIADAVLWLCSDRSAFVTGHALAVDGGWVAH